MSPKNYFSIFAIIELSATRIKHFSKKCFRVLKSMRRSAALSANHKLPENSREFWETDMLGDRVTRFCLVFKVDGSCRALYSSYCVPLSFNSWTEHCLLDFPTKNFIFFENDLNRKKTSHLWGFLFNFNYDTTAYLKLAAIPVQSYRIAHFQRITASMRKK